MSSCSSGTKVRSQTGAEYEKAPGAMLSVLKIENEDDDEDDYD